MTRAKKPKPCGESCPDVEARCDQPAGHEGEHSARFPTHVVRWPQ